MAESTSAVDDSSEKDGGKNYAKSIHLPNGEMFRNLRNAKSFAIDIGGSLAKIAYVSEVPRKRQRHYSVDSPQDDREQDQTLYTVEEREEPNQRLHFIKFETKYIEACVDFIQDNLLETGSQLKDKSIKATGGGAFKFTELLSKKLGMEVDKLDEMECLIKGCNFLLNNIPNECFQFSKDQETGKPKFTFQNLDSTSMYPYLLVNIGSGVSILKVESEDKYQRIGGTGTGGGTFWGLGSLLTNAKGFDELLDLATGGQHKNVDMLVKDIYGGDYAALNLPGDLIASSFGKTVRSSCDIQSDNGVPEFDQKDIAKSLLHMISNDIGQISSLYAQVHGLTRIFFGGYFIRGHPVTMHTISFACNYFSKGNQQALFLRHEGYLGAIGAFLKGAQDTDSQSKFTSWDENFVRSSGLPGINQYKRFPNFYGVLELDRVEHSLVVCPLIKEPQLYQPDIENLTDDEEARAYWLDHFEQSTSLYTDQAISSQSGQSDAKERGRKFKESFLERLGNLRRNPFKFGELTVRSLLDTCGQFMSEYGFYDPYLKVKQTENMQALSLLPQRLQHIINLEGESTIQTELVTGLLAGNVFDWGAKEIIARVKDEKFSFDMAKNLIKDRPWLRDDLDRWVQRCADGEPYKLATIFVDNSGCDIILGVFPVVINLLKKGTKVILAANSYPAVNDVICSELIILAERVATASPIVRQALTDSSLKIMDTGVGSPCIDLRRIDMSLANAIKDTDLLILVGMGRSIHTNHKTIFKCDTIKSAVLKNEHMAKLFAGQLFDVLFVFEEI